MSFSDLERGHGPGKGGRNRGGAGREDEVALLGGADDKQFAALADRVSLQIFRINSNVTGISKLVETLGTKRDSTDLRTKLHDLTEATKDLVKSSSADVKKLADFDLSSQDAPTRQRKLKQAKISRDFQTAILSYQSAAKESAKKQRVHVDRAKQAINQGDVESAGEALSPGASNSYQQSQQQLQVQEDLIPDSELEYQEQLIAEREGEIREIESGVLELNEIFRDLGTIVTEQQSMLDNIESNVISIANDTGGAAEELVQAHEYQRKAGRRMFCLMLIFIVVMAIVLLAILS